MCIQVYSVLTYHNITQSVSFNKMRCFHWNRYEEKNNNIAVYVAYCPCLISLNVFFCANEQSQFWC